MYKLSNREKVLKLFFDSPTKKFQIRQISRIIGLGLPSVRNYLLELESDNLIKKSPGQVFPFFVANRENRLFKCLKVNDTLLRIELSGLTTCLENIHPDCVILFGSSARGEDTEKSDLDLFIQSKPQNMNLTNYQNQINRKINVLFEPKASKLSLELKNNLANGIVLSGYLNLE